MKMDIPCIYRSFIVPLLLAILAFSHHSSAQTAWKITSVQIKSSNVSSISFVIERGSTRTNCSASWQSQPTDLQPTTWTQCADKMLRWRFYQFTSLASYTLQLVETDFITTSKPSLINVVRSNFTSPVSLPMALSTTTASFDAIAMDVFYTLTRNDGSGSGVIPCTEAYTFYITDPNVSVLGPLTLGRGTLHQWETICTTTWPCNNQDPSLKAWTPCKSPSFQFKKTLPPKAGDQISNFITSITHQFPLLMATSIRGSNAPDYYLTDPDEAAGLDVVLTLQDTAWKNGNGGRLRPIVGGGIDQMVGCNLGCEFDGVASWIDVVDVQVI